MTMLDERGLDTVLAADDDETAEAASGPFIPIPVPGIPLLQFSGFYETPPVPKVSLKGELRLDVDGTFPQMTASGVVRSGLFLRGSWIARLTATGITPGSWTGQIFFKEGSVSAIPHTKVQITAVRGKSATVVFSGGGALRTMKFSWISTAFHEVDMEFDSVAGTAAVTTMDTGDHPNRPAGLADEVLSIETVYRRAGFRVTKTGGDSIVPLAGAGAGAKWSDMEMHDAMQAHWSRFANKAQWSMWTLFASLHETGTSLGGIMFDDIGAQHRQGTAIFEDAFIANAPSGEASPVAWVRRMRFWTAVHEIGHSFNLAHSWQKALVDNGHGPWVALANEPEARSFMNYPYNVAGGQTAFFANFAFRFSDNELLFLRHAPSRFVQHGNAIWFDHHGFEQADVSAEPKMSLELRVHRPGARFAFLEPVDVELKLTNISDEPVLVPDSCLVDTDGMTIVVKRQGDEAKQQRSFAHLCLKSTKQVLMPGESMYGTVPVSAGLGGWNVDEPGRYMVQMALHLEDEDLVSNPMVLTVEPPMDRAEERVAPDYFTDDVARVLTFGGTQVLAGANETLEVVADLCKGRAPARHAQVALGRPYTIDYKLIVPGGGAAGAGPEALGIGPATNGAADASRIATKPADPAKAASYLDDALLEQPVAAAEALGHIRYKEEVDRLADTQAEQGDTKAAVATLKTLEKTLEARNVAPSVVAEVAVKQASYARRLR